MRLPIYAALVGLFSVSSAHAATVTLVIDGIEVGKGVVHVGFCDKGPLDECREYAAEQPATTDAMAFRFEDIPPGAYAFVGYQDINSNNEFDKNFVGMPKEPFALSNGAGDKLFPPPAYEDLAVPVVDGQDNVINVSLQRFGAKKPKSAETATSADLTKIPIVEVPTPGTPATAAAAPRK